MAYEATYNHVPNMTCRCITFILCRTVGSLQYLASCTTLQMSFDRWNNDLSMSFHIFLTTKLIH